jgi:hypothetical protein
LCVVLLALVGVGLALTMQARRRQVRARSLAAEIELSGGHCELPATVSDWVNYWRGDTVAPRPASVQLIGPHFTSAWLEEHDHLSDLRADRLAIRKSPLTGSDVEEISRQHPLRSWRAVGLRLADSAADSDWQVGELEEIKFVDSDLTDDGFQEAAARTGRGSRHRGNTCHGGGTQGACAL